MAETSNRGGGGRKAAAEAVAAINKRERRARRRRRALRWSLTLSALVLIFGGGFFYLIYDLPDQISFTSQEFRRPQVRIETRDGSVIAEISGRYSQAVAVRRLPEAVVESFLVAQDPGFRSHPGVTFADIGRLFSGGGPPSTLTLKVARQLFKTVDDGPRRRIQELLVGLWLERRFGKDAVLRTYLERVHLGSGIYGIEAAARLYFSRSPQALTLDQGAALAAASRDPVRYHPLYAPRATARQANALLTRMNALGRLSQGDARRYQRRAVRAAPSLSAGAADRYIVDAALARLAEIIGFTDRDLVVRTTIDARLQRLAEDNLRSYLDGPLADRRVGQGAVLTTTPDGEVRAYVAGRDYDPRRRNRVSGNARQSGGLFKLFAFLVALERGFDPQSWVRDNPVVLNGWRPRNDNNRYMGQVTLRDAFALSLNTVPAQIAKRYGVAAIADMARELGVRSPLSEDPQMVLGIDRLPMSEIATAYGVLANGGYKVDLVLVGAVYDTEGALIYRRPDIAAQRILSPERVSQANLMLSAALTHGLAQNARLNRPAAGQAATSPGNRDAWFVGYSAEMLTAVWLGNDDGRRMLGVTGAKDAARLWRRYMLDAHEDIPARTLARAAGDRAKRFGDGAWQEFTRAYRD